MTKEEKEKAIDALKISAPIHALTEEEFNDYIQTLNKVMDWLEQEPKTGQWIEVVDEIDTLGNKTWHHKCSICGNENSGWGAFKYCPDCGAKMESEDKE